jgi:hypothetical protein
VKSDLLNRTFQLWEYKVSHGSLLVRSPRNEADDQLTNIDIVCTGVEYVALPRFLVGVEICSASEIEVETMKAHLLKDVTKADLYVFLSQKRRYVVVAASIKIEENDLDIFDSPFE